MKLIDYLKDLAEGKKLPHFILQGEEYYIGADGFLKIDCDDVEWMIYKDWLNEEIELLEEDAFIDIEEITIRDKTIGFPNGAWTARNMDKAFSIKINEIIKNQKKIINKLKENK